MSRVYTSGYEETNSASNALTMGWGAVNGSATISTTNPHSGTYCLLSPSTATTGAWRRDFATNVTSGTYYFRWYFRTSTATPGSNTTMFVSRSDADATCMSVALLTTGQIRLTNVANASTTFDTVGSVTADTWYRIELRHLIHASAGDMELRWYLGDNTTEIETPLLTSGVDTLITNIRWQYIGKFTATNSVAFAIDDVACNVASGTFQTSWCGPAKTALMVPTGDSTPVEWTPSTGTDHFALVDDAPGAPDDDTTYVSAAVANREDWYTLTDLPAEVPSTATLILADTMARWKGNAVTPQVRVRFWDGVAITAGTTHTLTTSYAFTNTNNKLVTDLAGKTKANAANFESAVQVIDALEARCTATWTNIEWLEATGVNTNIEVPTTVYTGP